jgi:phospholipase D1/2
MGTILSDRNETSIFEPGRNCWREEVATQASLLVDYANYYRAVFESICKARRSVFILGWDIDTRIELLRGADRFDKKCPVELFELINWKARQNPDIRFYVNKWNYSYFFARDRELLAGLKWRWRTPPNVQYVADSVTPIAGCHHQKIIVVDDEIAFCGGMDIAPCRWDRREHFPVNANRRDPDGIHSIARKVSFGPYHDIQMIVAGPAARSLAEWARYRWKRAKRSEAIPLFPGSDKKFPPSWPDSVPVDFKDVPMAIARTAPAMRRERPVREIETMLLDEIAQAENFVYIENQFLTVEKIARALNERLRQKTGMRVLIISCDVPKGVMEAKAMWTGRVIFNDILKAGGVAARAVIAHPVSRVRGVEEPVRIHSKLMIVDDRFLHVGSANINNRSFGFDTECDLVIEGRDPATRTRIAALRNDLIREHTGQKIEKISESILRGKDVDFFLNYLTTSRQHLRKIDDEHFRHERFAKAARLVADPGHTLIPGRSLALAVLLVLAVAALPLAWKFTPLAAFATPERIAPLLESARASAWTVPGLILLYVAFTAILFPVVILDVSTVMVFGLPWGLLLALTGASASATLGFYAGRLTRMRPMKMSDGRADMKVMEYLKNISIAGMVLLRMLPVAPFSVVNFTVGMSRMPFMVFIAGTWLGLLPGLFMMSVLRGSLLQLWRHFDLEHGLTLGAGVLLWLSVLAAVNRLAHRRRNEKASRFPI